MAKLKSISIKGEKFFYGFSFDIDDFIGDGIWWLKIYDGSCNLIYDKPFTSSMGKLETQKVREIIKQEFLTYEGAIL